MNQQTVKILSVLLLCILTILMNTGCATLIDGTTQDIAFTTEPSGANITIDGKTLQTPTSFELQRKKKYIAEITMPGYHPVQIQLEHQLNGWALGNILLGGIVGGIIDYKTGSINNINPSEVHFVMTPTSEPEPTTSTWNAKALKTLQQQTPALSKE